MGVMNAGRIGLSCKMYLCICWNNNIYFLTNVLGYYNVLDYSVRSVTLELKSQDSNKASNQNTHGHVKGSSTRVRSKKRSKWRERWDGDW